MTAAIKAVPMTYRGTRFRSTLEADWAATFDSLGWYWQYEPEAFLVDGVAYRPDFYLPTMRVWCEVKGPHDERLDKAEALNRALGSDTRDIVRPLVLIMRAPGPGDVAVWQPVDGFTQQSHCWPVIVQCPDCQHWTFVDANPQLWWCRRCYFGVHKTNDTASWHDWNQPRQISFVRAPRPPRRSN